MITPSFCCRRSQTNNQHKPKGSKRQLSTLLPIMPATYSGSIHRVGKYVPPLCPLPLSPGIGSPLHSPNGENFDENFSWLPISRERGLATPTTRPDQDHHMFVSPRQIIMYSSGSNQFTEFRLKFKFYVFIGRDEYNYNVLVHTSSTAPCTQASTCELCNVYVLLIKLFQLMVSNTSFPHNRARLRKAG